MSARESAEHPHYAVSAKQVTSHGIRQVCRSHASVLAGSRLYAMLHPCSASVPYGSGHLAPRGPRLPPELCDMIIDLLEDDDEVLKACALTCRGWLLRSRVHLWSFLEISDGESCARLAQVLDQSPFLAPLVQELLLIEGTAEEEDEAEQERPMWVHHGIIPLSRKFPALRTLEFAQMQWSTYCSVAVAALLYLASPITDLSLSSCSFTTCGQFKNLLEAATSLDTLSVYNTSFQDHGPMGYSMDGRVRRHIYDVHLSSLHGEVIGWVLAGSKLCCLSRLSVLEIGPEEARVVGLFLHLLGESLHSLEIAFRSFVWTGETLKGNELPFAFT